MGGAASCSMTYRVYWQQRIFLDYDSHKIWCSVYLGLMKPIKIVNASQTSIFMIFLHYHMYYKVHSSAILHSSWSLPILTTPPHSEKNPHLPFLFAPYFQTYHLFTIFRIVVSIILACVFLFPFLFPFHFLSPIPFAFSSSFLLIE